MNMPDSRNADEQAPIVLPTDPRAIRGGSHGGESPPGRHGEDGDHRKKGEDESKGDTLPDGKFPER